MSRLRLINQLITSIEEGIPYYEEKEFHNLSYDEKLLFHKEVENTVTTLLNGLLELEKME